jgi:transposase
MNSRHDWSDMTQERLQELVDRHGTLTAAAKHLGVSRSSLSHLISRQGIAIRYDRSRRRKRASVLDQYAPILKHLASIGWSCSRMATALDLPVQDEQVRRWLHANGVELRVQRGAPKGKWNPAWVDGQMEVRASERDIHQYQAKGAAEMKLGRELREGEVIHHIDGDPSNNAPENLEICESHKEHMQIHHAQWQADYRERLSDLRGADREYVCSLGW